MYERIEALDQRVRSKENKYLKRQEDEQEDDKEEAADFEVTIQSMVGSTQKSNGFSRVFLGSPSLSKACSSPIHFIPEEFYSFSA